MGHLSKSIVVQRRGFTLVELLATIAILAVIVTVAGVYVGSYVKQAQKVADQKTLETLNDALTRYKTQGGNLAALTSGTAIKHVIAMMQTPVSWAGLTQQFLNAGFTRPARSIFAKGSGAQYHFTAYNTYTSETGGSSPTGNPVVIYLTTTGSGTWTVPADWNSANNTIECIGGGGSGYSWGVNCGGGGGGAYAKSVNLVLTPGSSINYSVGTTAAATWFNATGLANAQSIGAAVACAADYGRNASSSSGATGGLAGNSVGSTTYSGGTGGAGSTSAGGGGGGAAGPYGNGGSGGSTGAYNEPGGGGGGGGGNGGTNPSGAYGGNGGNNHLGSGAGAGAVRYVSAAQPGTAGGGGGGGECVNQPSTVGGVGGNGTEWDASHGSGGGGGGSEASGSYPAGVGGGLYGGGGGGGGTGPTGGLGAQGIIVITYLP